MGLDNFKSESASVNTSQSKSKSTTKEQQSVDDAYKVYTSDDGRKKVFQSEEDWNDAIDFIQEEFGISESEVEHMNATERHDILHQAIIGERGKLSQNFYPTRQCIVCDEVFSFPTKWNFSKFKGEAVCNTHTVNEVLDTYREVNELVDGED